MEAREWVCILVLVVVAFAVGSYLGSNPVGAGEAIVMGLLGVITGISLMLLVKGE